MTRRRVALWSIGVLGCAAVAAAASRSDPVEARVPPSRAVPAAESVETVLRATYALPSGRGQALGEFLVRNAVAGIDVQVREDRLTVVAPEDAQRALGTFIERCIRKEPSEPHRRGPAVPSYADPVPEAFDAPPYGTFEGTLTPPLTPGSGAPPDDGFDPPQPVRKKGASKDGFQPAPSKASPFMEGT